MDRRACLDFYNPSCSIGRPPIVDYPGYSSTTTANSDLLNVDIKVPGEHTLEGVPFDAEIQMLTTHLDPNPARTASIGLPIRARSNGGFNAEFQLLLDLFQRTYDSDAELCRQNRRRNLRSGGQNTTATGSANTTSQEDRYDDDIYYAFSDSDDSIDEQQKTMMMRDLQQQRNLSDVPQRDKFDPFSEAFMPGIFFYRYDGSITEPPCMDVTWFVMMEPMTISVEQLNQIKRILFTHQDPDESCRRTSVHNADQSVARPIYPLGENREIQKCGPGSFISDEEKGRGDGNICFP